MNRYNPTKSRYSQTQTLLRKVLEKTKEVEIIGDVAKVPRGVEVADEYIILDNMHVRHVVEYVRIAGENVNLVAEGLKGYELHYVSPCGFMDLEVKGFGGKMIHPIDEWKCLFHPRSVAAELSRVDRPNNSHDVNPKRMEKQVYRKNRNHIALHILWSISRYLKETCFGIYKYTIPRARNADIDRARQVKQINTNNQKALWFLYKVLGELAEHVSLSNVRQSSQMFPVIEENFKVDERYHVLQYVHNFSEKNVVFFNRLHTHAKNINAGTITLTFTPIVYEGLPPTAQLSDFGKKGFDRMKQDLQMMQLNISFDCEYTEDTSMVFPKKQEDMRPVSVVPEVRPENEMKKSYKAEHALTIRMAAEDHYDMYFDDVVPAKVEDTKKDLHLYSIYQTKSDIQKFGNEGSKLLRYTPDQLCAMLLSQIVHSDANVFKALANALKAALVTGYKPSWNEYMASLPVSIEICNQRNFAYACMKVDFEGLKVSSNCLIYYTCHDVNFKLLDYHRRIRTYRLKYEPVRHKEGQNQFRYNDRIYINRIREGVDLMIVNTFASGLYSQHCMYGDIQYTTVDNRVPRVGMALQRSHEIDPESSSSSDSGEYYSDDSDDNFVTDMELLNDIPRLSVRVRKVRAQDPSQPNNADSVFPEYVANNQQKQMEVEDGYLRTKQSMSFWNNFCAKIQENRIEVQTLACDTVVEREIEGVSEDGVTTHVIKYRPFIEMRKDIAMCIQPDKGIFRAFLQRFPTAQEKWTEEWLKRKGIHIDPYVEKGQIFCYEVKSKEQKRNLIFWHQDFAFRLARTTWFHYKTIVEAFISHSDLTKSVAAIYMFFAVMYDTLLEILKKQDPSTNKESLDAEILEICMRFIYCTIGANPYISPLFFHWLLREYKRHVMENHEWITFMNFDVFFDSFKDAVVPKKDRVYFLIEYDKYHEFENVVEFKKSHSKRYQDDVEHFTFDKYAITHHPNFNKVSTFNGNINIYEY
jgi:hypothetical protein